MIQSSFQRIDASISREVETKYDNIKAVADKLTLIEAVKTLSDAGALDATISAAAAAAIVINMDVATGAEGSSATWDGATGLLTIPRGDTGPGSGDMLKSIYDTNNDGIVDNASKVNDHTVEEDVPSGAKFTDTTYSVGDNGLTERNFTEVLKNKLDNIEAEAEKNDEDTTLMGNVFNEADKLVKLDNNKKLPVADAANLTGLGIADRTALKAYKGTLGQTVLQKDIDLKYEWVEPQLSDNGVTVINVDGDSTGSWKAIYSGAINIEWGGASSTNSLNSDIINNIAVLCKAENKTLLVPDNMDFECSEHILLDSISVTMNGSLISTMPDDTTIGSTFITIVGTKAKTVEINIKRKVESDWVNDLSAGISLGGTYAKIIIKNIDKFNKSMFMGDYVFAWNEIYWLGRSNNAQYCLYADNSINRVGSSANFTNENTWYRLDHQIHSDSVHATTSEPKWIIKAIGTGASFNSNTFVNPAFEVHAGNYTILDLFQVGTLRIRDPRNEITGSNTRLLKMYHSDIILENSDKQKIEFHFPQTFSSWAYNPIRTLEDFGLKNSITEIFNINMCSYLKETNGCYGFTKGDAGNLTTNLANPYTISNGVITKTYSSVDFNSGVLVKMNDANIIECAYTTIDNGPVKFAVQFLDVNGVMLTESDLDGDIMKHIDCRTSLAYTSDGYKLWTTGSSVYGSDLLLLGIDTSIIKYVRINVTGNEALSKFTIKTNKLYGGVISELITSGTPVLKSDIIYLNDIEAVLPTSDPAIANRLWSDNGTVKISAG